MKVFALHLMAVGSYPTRVPQEMCCVMLCG
jgi:hypothetical protein